MPAWRDHSVTQSSEAWVSCSDLILSSVPRPAAGRGRTLHNTDCFRAGWKFKEGDVLSRDFYNHHHHPTQTILTTYDSVKFPAQPLGNFTLS